MLTYKNYNKLSLNPNNIGVYNDPLATIYHEYASLVRVSISKVLKNKNGKFYLKDELDDFVQDFFCNIVKKDILNKIDVSKGSISTFLWKSAQNFAIDKVRFLNRRKRNHTKTIPYDDFPINPSSSNHGEDIESTRDCETILEKVLPKLSVMEKNIMKYSVDGITPKEISAKTDLSLNEVYKHRSKAFQKTKAVMSNLGY